MKPLYKLGQRVRCTRPASSPVTGVVVGHTVIFDHPAVHRAGHDTTNPEPIVMVGLDAGIEGHLNGLLLTIIPFHPDSLEAIE